MGRRPLRAPSSMRVCRAGRLPARGSTTPLSQRATGSTRAKPRPVPGAGRPAPGRHAKKGAPIVRLLDGNQASGFPRSGCVGQERAGRPVHPPVRRGPWGRSPVDAQWIRKPRDRPGRPCHAQARPSSWPVTKPPPPGFAHHRDPRRRRPGAAGAGCVR